MGQGYSIPQHKECGSRCMKILDCNHKCIGDHLCRDSKGASGIVNKMIYDDDK